MNPGIARNDRWRTLKARRFPRRTSFWQFKVNLLSYGVGELTERPKVLAC